MRVRDEGNRTDKGEDGSGGGVEVSKQRRVRVVLGEG